MMDERHKESERAFLVQCIWCGAKIREDKHEETPQVCA